MPTAAHESAVSKLRDHPALLSKLVRKAFHAALDPHLKPIDATLRFANPQEVRPDLVFLGRRPRWLIVELQNSTDPAKRRRWLLARKRSRRARKRSRRAQRRPAARPAPRWTDVLPPPGSVSRKRAPLASSCSSTHISISVMN